MTGGGRILGGGDGVGARASGGGAVTRRGGWRIGEPETPREHLVPRIDPRCPADVSGQEYHGHHVRIEGSAWAPGWDAEREHGDPYVVIVDLLEADLSEPEMAALVRVCPRWCSPSSLLYLVIDRYRDAIREAAHDLTARTCDDETGCGDEDCDECRRKRLRNAHAERVIDDIISDGGQP